MPENHQSAELEWRDGLPVSTRFQDPYYSLADGLAETRHVFLAGNGLPDRFASGFRIAELGFGTGLNVLAAWAAWRAAGMVGDLRFTSFEAYPISAPEMARAHERFPEVAELSPLLVSAWEAATGTCRRIRLDGLQLDVLIGLAEDRLPRWEGRADAWFLDGFAPARNPGLWADPLLAEVAAHTAPGGTAATYSAAGAVRRGLAAAGFAVERVPGYGRKRHMTVARLA